MASGFQKMVQYKIKSMLARKMRLIGQNVTCRRGPVEASVKSVGQRFQWLGKTLKGIRLRVSCQEEVDREEITSLSINRRANKDN